MGAISSDGLFDVTLTVRVAARSEDAACPTCALARTFGASPDDARFDVTCLSCSCGVTTIARQARTIRRLFTAYFLAKGKLRRKEEVHRMATRLAEFLAKEGERARIVAALRTGLPTGGPDTAHDENTPRGYGCVCIGCVHRDVLIRAADAIERGEL